MSLSATLTSAIRDMCAPPSLSTDLISAADKRAQREAYKALVDLDFLKMALTRDMGRPDWDLPPALDMAPYVGKRALTDAELGDLTQWLDVKGYTCTVKAQSRYVYNTFPCYDEPFWTLGVTYKE